MLTKTICKTLNLSKAFAVLPKTAYYYQSLTNTPHCLALFSTKKAETTKMQFKAETKKLLDIVAKSLYTDSEVFLRQLLSNASDALQKQRFNDQSRADLSINIQTVETKNQLIIFDNGIGMSQEELIENLGTIAKSGSKEFLKSIQNKKQVTPDNIIGQFGVGFYSSFIVANRVEVVSKAQGHPCFAWSSQGDGTFDITEVSDDPMERGTKIILYLKEDYKKFCQKDQIQKIVQKYSNFINFPISINNEAVNLVKALWSRDKNSISEQQYDKFYQYIANTSESYKYKLHFEADSPLSIKAIIYIPKRHNEMFGMTQEKNEVSLYCKKVLIKKNCGSILFPEFLRFVKGVIDCQDIPLNVSRENYQDSALMAKIKTLITKKILKHLLSQSEKNPEEYSSWYQTFSNFIKEGSLSSDFKDITIHLNRYEVTTNQGLISLKEYVAAKKPKQDRIFYIVAKNRQQTMSSPYVEPLIKAGIPVLSAPRHIDELIFREVENIQGLKFSSVQTDQEDIERNIKAMKEEDQKPEEENKETGIKQEDLTAYSLWIKNELQPYVNKVVVSKKSITAPALVISPISSAMRQITMMQMSMMSDKQQFQPRQHLTNLTFQFNPKHKMIIQINQLRKSQATLASDIIRQLFDNCCLDAGLECDAQSMVKRINSLMTTILSSKQNQ